MSDIIFRTLAQIGADVQIRADGDQRTIEGVAVPYDIETRIDPRLTESFARGAFRNQVKDPARIPLFREHGPMGGKLIGKVTSLRDDASGLYFEARVSPTAAGDETLALVRDGVLDSVSIGFRTGQDARLPNGTIQRRSATLTELAVVGNPAYKGAKITGTRGACPQCGQCTDEDPTGLRAEVEKALAELRALPLPPMPGRPKVTDVEELAAAVKAADTDNAADNATRAYLIGKAKAMNAAHMIPKNWQPDGSVAS